MGPKFGSQMTQYASLYSVAKELDSEIVFIDRYLSGFRKVELFDAFDLPNKIIKENDLQFSTFTLKDKLIDNDVFTLDKNTNWNIEGWFHTFTYFHHLEEEIRKVFKFKDYIIQEAENNITKIKNSEPYPLVSLHVRRGDYLAVSSLNIGLSYYNNAISVFLNELKQSYFKLLIFSDDIEWCKENIQGENVFYVEDNSNYVDMHMMSLCDHHILANSSFSWWGAYLNSSKEKLVVCPFEYVNDTAHNFINGSYFPSTWIPIHAV